MGLLSPGAQGRPPAIRSQAATSTSTISTGERAVDRRRGSRPQAASGVRDRTGAAARDGPACTRRSPCRAATPGRRAGNAARGSQHARDAGACRGRVVEACLVARHLANISYWECELSWPGGAAAAPCRARGCRARPRSPPRGTSPRRRRRRRSNDVEGPGAVVTAATEGAQRMRAAASAANPPTARARACRGAAAVRDDRVEERQREVARDAVRSRGPPRLQRAQQRRPRPCLHARSRRAFSASPGRSCAIAPLRSPRVRGMSIVSSVFFTSSAISVSPRREAAIEEERCPGRARGRQRRVVPRHGAKAQHRFGGVRHGHEAPSAHAEEELHARVLDDDREGVALEALETSAGTCGECQVQPRRGSAMEAGRRAGTSHGAHRRRKAMGAATFMGAPPFRHAFANTSRSSSMPGLPCQ